MQNIGLILLVFAFDCIACVLPGAGRWSFLPLAIAFWLGE